MNQLLNGERNRHADVMGLILVVNKQSLMPFKLLIEYLQRMRSTKTLMGLTAIGEKQTFSRLLEIKRSTTWWEFPSWIESTSR